MLGEEGCELVMRLPKPGIDRRATRCLECEGHAHGGVNAGHFRGRAGLTRGSCGETTPRQPRRGFGTDGPAWAAGMYEIAKLDATNIDT